MPWSLAGTVPFQALPSERWEGIFLPTNIPPPTAWAIRVPSSPECPENWDTAGKYCCGCLLDGQTLVGPIRPLHLQGRGANQSLTVLQYEDFPLLGGLPGQYYVLASVHRWVPRTVLELWGWL